MNYSTLTSAPLLTWAVLGATDEDHSWSGGREYSTLSWFSFQHWLKTRSILHNSSFHILPVTPHFNVLSLFLFQSSELSHISPYVVGCSVLIPGHQTNWSFRLENTVEKPDSKVSLGWDAIWCLMKCPVCTHVYENLRWVCDHCWVRIWLHLWLIMFNMLEASPLQLLPLHKSHTSGPLIPCCSRHGNTQMCTHTHIQKAPAVLIYTNGIQRIFLF